MNKKEAIKVIEILKKSYPDAKCSLDFRTPFEMLVAVCLSAQCTDDRVNKTTPSLFAKFDTPEEESCFIADRIEELIAMGMPANEIAVLFRKKKYMQSIIDELKKRNIRLSISQPGRCCFGIRRRRSAI